MKRNKINGVVFQYWFVLPFIKLTFFSSSNAPFVLPQPILHIHTNFCFLSCSHTRLTQLIKLMRTVFFLLSWITDKKNEKKKKKQGMLFWARIAKEKWNFKITTCNKRRLLLLNFDWKNLDYTLHALVNNLHISQPVLY